MKALEVSGKKIYLAQGDLPSIALALAEEAATIAVDIETSGLDWRKDQIATYQVYIPDSSIYIVRVDNDSAHYFNKILQHANIQKIFHHAIFDLRFIERKWASQIQNVACTKIASKILDPNRKEHSLKDLLRVFLEISIDKSQQTSTWTQKHLTAEQIQYAATDVLHLPRLFQALQRELMSCGRWPLAKASFDYLMTRVQLDILGISDIYQY